MAKLPPIQTLSACPHCGYEEFYVVQTYSGRGRYARRFDGIETYNGEMYDCLNVKAGKTAFCGRCDKRVACWNDEEDGNDYGKPEPGRCA